MIAVIDGLLDLPTGTPDVPPVETLQLFAAPNPFNPQTHISFFLERNQPVSLHIMDQRGRLVRTLMASEPQNAGRNEVYWNGQDDQGRPLPSGLYMARIRTINKTAVTKLTLMK